MVLEGEARNLVVRLRLESGPRDAPFGRGGEDRQSRARDQIFDQRGEEHRLAGAREAGDAETQAPAGKVVAERTGDQPGLEHKIGEKRQGMVRT